MIVRVDLPRGVQAAQLVHAAGESASTARGRLPSDTHAVVLGVCDEAELKSVRERLVLACLPHVVIVENDEPWTGQIMALGLEPARREAVRRVLSSLPLLK